MVITIDNNSFTGQDESPLGPLPDGWNLCKLKDLTVKIGSGATPRGGSDVYLPTRLNYALIRSQNVFDRRFDTDGLAFISNEDAKQLQGVKVEIDDILLNITGDGITFSRACLAPKEILPACVNQHVAIIRLDRKKCLPGFLLSYLTHPVIKNYIESFNAGGSRRAITKGHIEAFEIPLPPLPEQQAIASILRALDDKIELNRRMNQTLEAMARALFQSWFVDFDPVRAKMEGRPPSGLDPATADLFPASFEASSLGEIPRGWKYCALKEFAEIQRHSINPGKFPEEIFAHFSLPAFDEGQLPKIELGTEIKSNKFLIPRNAVLVSKLNPHIPRIWFPNINNQNRSICSTEFLVVVPKPGINREFLYSLFINDTFLTTFQGLVTGTTGSHQRVQPEDLLNIKVVLPTLNLVNHFGMGANALFQKITTNLIENGNLASLRDELLPRLMSGELRVKEAEKELSSVL